MDNKNDAPKKKGALEKFFAGKGFYIVLLLCAAVIGVSAWSLFNGEGAVSNIDMEDRVPAVTTPKPTAEPSAVDEPNNAEEVIAIPPETVSETPIVQTTPAPTATPAPTVADPAATEPETWAWPVIGPVDREYSIDALMYDATMGDWRTHNGVDIEAVLGSHVTASAAGTVTDIYDDPLYGTTVVISHGGGYETVYSNLAELPTVEIGDTVAAGETIGSVGTSAICEAGQVYHLHFAMRLDGESVDPTSFLA